MSAVVVVQPVDIRHPSRGGAAINAGEKLETQSRWWGEDGVVEVSSSDPATAEEIWRGAKALSPAR